MRERFRWRWFRFTTYMQYLWGKLSGGPYICEDCGDIIDKDTVIQQLYGHNTREDMFCSSCIYMEDYCPEEDYVEEDEEFPPYDKPYDDEDEYWPSY